MGLDIYAGTMTRYYANNWKSVVQQWAEKNGYHFERISPNQEENVQAVDEEPLSAEEIRQTVENWRDYLLHAMAQPEKEPFDPWEDDNEKPYYTDKPDWDAFGAMLLVAACKTYEEQVPETVKKNWEYWEHPMYKKMAADQGKIWSLFQDVKWWLPLDDCFMIQGPLPTGEMVRFGTVGLLRAELEKLNELAWNEEEKKIVEWRETEGYPPNFEFGEDGKMTPIGQGDDSEYNTDSLAKFAFSIFWQAMKFAEENRVPIVLDF